MTWKDPRGYVRLLHLGREVYEHRLVAERLLGRPLRSGESVHHRNGRRDDNRPANIEVVNHADHVRVHWKKGDYRARVHRQTKALCHCPRCGTYGHPHARRMCKRCYHRDYYERNPEKWTRE